MEQEVARDDRPDFCKINECPHGMTHLSGADSRAEATQELVVFCPLVFHEICTRDQLDNLSPDQTVAGVLANCEFATSFDGVEFDDDLSD